MQNKQFTPTTQTTQPSLSSNLTATTQVGATQDSAALTNAPAVHEDSQQQYTDIYNNPVTNYLKQIGGIEPYPTTSSDYVPDSFRPSKGAADATSSSEQPVSTFGSVPIDNHTPIVDSTLVPNTDSSSSHSSNKTILLATVKPGKLPPFAHPVAQPTNSVRDAFCEALIPIFAKGYRTSRATYKRAKRIATIAFMIAVIPIFFLVFYNIYPWFTVPPLVLVILYNIICTMVLNRRRLFDAGQPTWYVWISFAPFQALTNGLNFILDDISAATAQDELPRYLTFFSKK